MKNTLIESVVVNMSEKQNMNGDVARAVLKQDHKNVANQIALTYLQFNRERIDAARAEKQTGVRGNDPIAKPEFMLSFIQAVMNNICWGARRLHIANSAEDFANGIDFSQDVADELNIDNTAHLAELVDEDFMTLNNLHTWLAGQMDYLNDIQPLFHFSQSEKIDDEWVTTHQCTSFDDAFTVMTEIVESLDSVNVEKQQAEASAIDFSVAA